MTVKEKRPPISIVELEKKVRNRATPEQGELGYVSGQKDLPKVVQMAEEGGEVSRIKRSRSSVDSVRAISFWKIRFTIRKSILMRVLPIVTSVALAAVMILLFAPSKAHFTTLLGEVEGLRESAAWIAGKVDAEIIRLEGKDAGLEASAAAGLKSLRDSVEALSNRINILEAE